MTARPVVHRPDGRSLMRVLACAAETDDDLGIVEMTFEPGAGGPPLHVHPTHGEGFYVLSGELTVQVGDEVHTGDAGTWFWAPRNTPHTLANPSDHVTRLLSVFAPGGFERRFQRMLVAETGIAVPDELHASETATQVVGPPLPRRC